MPNIPHSYIRATISNDTPATNYYNNFIYQHTLTPQAIEDAADRATVRIAQDITYDMFRGTTTFDVVPQNIYHLGGTYDILTDSYQYGWYVAPEIIDNRNYGIAQHVNSVEWMSSLVSGFQTK